MGDGGREVCRSSPGTPKEKSTYPYPEPQQTWDYITTRPHTFCNEIKSAAVPLETEMITVAGKWMHTESLATASCSFSFSAEVWRFDHPVQRTCINISPNDHRRKSSAYQQSQPCTQSLARMIESQTKGSIITNKFRLKYSVCFHFKTNITWRPVKVT